LVQPARGLYDEFKLAHPEIPWRPITARRHRLAHEYGEIDDTLIWRVATVHVPLLIAQLQLLVAPPPAADDDDGNENDESPTCSGD